MELSGFTTKELQAIVKYYDCEIQYREVEEELKRRLPIIRWVFSANVFVDAKTEEEARKIVADNNPMTSQVNSSLPNIILTSVDRDMMRRSNETGFEEGGTL